MSFVGSFFRHVIIYWFVMGLLPIVQKSLHILLSMASEENGLLFIGVHMCVYNT
jgi:hypothetical protein